MRRSEVIAPNLVFVTEVLPLSATGNGAVSLSDHAHGQVSRREAMSLIALPVAGAGGREVFVNPRHVVCLLDAGPRRTQIVTTALAAETSISLIVELTLSETAHRLGLAPEPQTPVRAEA
jgi:hypothetical protein